MAPFKTFTPSRVTIKIACFIFVVVVSMVAIRVLWPDKANHPVVGFYSVEAAIWWMGLKNTQEPNRRELFQAALAATIVGFIGEIGLSLFGKSG